jgi:hypothetical protein
MRINADYTNLKRTSLAFGFSFYLFLLVLVCVYPRKSAADVLLACAQDAIGSNSLVYNFAYNPADINNALIRKKDQTD